MIHPVFNELQDIKVAEVCSEIFKEREYIFVTNEESNRKYDCDSFPPTPAYFGSVIFAYIDKLNTGMMGIRQQMIMLGSGMVTTDEIADMYSKNVGEVSNLSGILDGIDYGVDEHTGEFIDCKEWYVRKTLQKGNKLLSAHIIARTVSEGELIGATVLPRIVSEDLPLLARDTVIAMRSDINELKKSGFSRLSDYQIDEMLKLFSTNDPILKGLGHVAACSLLPDAGLISSRLGDTQEISGSHSSSTNPNRAARRANKHNKRRLK